MCGRRRVRARALEDEIAAALAWIARARQAKEQDDLATLGQLLALLDGLRGRLVALPEDEAPRLRSGLLALLDEVAGFAADLEASRGELALRLRQAGAHRRAEAAYRTAGRA